MVPVIKKRNRLDTSITEINDIEAKKHTIYRNSDSLNVINKIMSPTSGGSEHDSGQEDEDESGVNANTPLMAIRRTTDQAVSDLMIDCLIQSRYKFSLYFLFCSGFSSNRSITQSRRHLFDNKL